LPTAVIKNVDGTKPNLHDSMNDLDPCEREHHAATCKCADAGLAASEASAARMDHRESQVADLAKTQAAC
jgi:hypothetical protein